MSWAATGRAAAGPRWEAPRVRAETRRSMQRGTRPGTAMRRAARLARVQAARVACPPRVWAAIRESTPAPALAEWARGPEVRPAPGAEEDPAERMGGATEAVTSVIPRP